MAGLCRPAEAVLASAEATRYALSPAAIAVVSSSGESGGGDALPETFALGRASDGGVVLLLRFEAPWKDAAAIESAFLVLSPVSGAPVSGAATRVELSRIVEEWSPEVVSWGRQPRLDLPELAAVLRPRASGPVRIDVTRFVREWPRRKADDHGIALLASGSDAYGLWFSTGLTRDEPPHIEVYVR